MLNESALIQLMDNIPIDRNGLNKWHDSFLHHFMIYMQDRNIHPAEIISLLIGLISINKTKLTPEHVNHNLIQLYCKSNGLTNELFSRILGEGIFSKEKLNDADENLDNIFKSTEFNGHIAKTEIDLNSIGYSHLPCELREEVVTQLHKFAEISDYEFRDVYAPERKFSLENPNCVMAEVKKNQIYENKLIMSIANSSLLRSFANEYLGATPFLHNIQMWYSFPHPTGRGQSESAQLFHYDMDGIKWVKFFIHLTDTNPETGMHCFVPGTHLVGAKNRRLLAKGYSRIEDAEMREWQSADFRYISAKAGQIVCGDTKCWHKGSELLKGKRLMLQIQYSINPFSQNYGI